MTAANDRQRRIPASIKGRMVINTLITALVTALVTALAITAGGCHASSAAQVQVLGVRQVEPGNADQIYVRLVNTANKPMRLQRLEYTVATSTAETTASQRPEVREVKLTREIAPGSSVIVAIPFYLDFDLGERPRPVTLTLSGLLFAELDRIVQQIPVHAIVR